LLFHLVERRKRENEKGSVVLFERMFGRGPAFADTKGGSIMSWRSASFVKEAMLVVAPLLLMVPRVVAGDATHAPDARPTIRYPSAPAHVVRMAPAAGMGCVVVTIVPQPTRRPFHVNLRGPDGQLRRFPVEAGREAIEYEQFVLRPGQSLTIRWVAAKGGKRPSSTMSEAHTPAPESNISKVPFRVRK
jgi:hypothetical protein